MALTGTEAEIVNVIAELKGASKNEINKEIGLSLDYIGYICRYLARKGEIVFLNGRYYMPGAVAKTPPAKESQTDKSFVREIVDQVARGLSGELKEEIRKISRGASVEAKPEETVKIKTDYDVPVRDESVDLDSNINRVGAKSENEKFDINKLIESLTRVRKGGK